MTDNEQYASTLRVFSKQIGTLRESFLFPDKADHFDGYCKEDTASTDNFLLAMAALDQAQRFMCLAARALQP